MVPPRLDAGRIEARQCPRFLEGGKYSVGVVRMLLEVAELERDTRPHARQQGSTQFPAREELLHRQSGGVFDLRQRYSGIDFLNPGQRG